MTRSSQPQPQPHVPAPPGTGVVQCRFCGCVPGVLASFQRIQGMIIMWSTKTVRGPFCRDCGIATFRQMTSETLVMGWWGPFSWILVPVTVLFNLDSRRKVTGLPAPSPPASGPWRRSMDHGRRVLARPDVIAILSMIACLVIAFGVPLVMLMVLDAHTPYDPATYAPPP